MQRTMTSPFASRSLAQHRRRWQPAACAAIAGVSGLLLALWTLFLAACGGGNPTVIVEVSGIPGQIQALRYTATLGGQPVRPAENLPGDVKQALYPLPSGSSGTFSVEVRAIGSDGCAQASGRGEASIAGGRQVISVALQANAPPLCSVEVSTSGDGVITSNPTGLSCGTQCRLDAPAGSRITLSVTPGAQSFFSGWSGACAGTGTCDLVVTRPLSAQARFVQQLCTAGKVCWESPLPLDVNLNAIWGFATDNLWAVGDGGQILHWDGSRWNLQPSGVTRNLMSIWGPSATDIYAVGDQGTILHFDGTAWSPIPPPGGMTPNLNVVRGSSASDVWAVGGASTIFRYNGTTWTLQPGGPVGNVIGLYVAPDGTAFVSSASGIVSRWNGTMFVAVPVGGGPMYAISGLSASNVLFSGDSNAIGTFDGQTYRALPGYPSASALHGSHFRAARDAWLVGIDGSVLHFDGGSLIRHPVPTTSYLNGVYAVSESDVWAVGSRGTLLHYDGTGWAAYGRPSEPGGAAFNAISGTSPKDLWAVGSGNSVVRNTGQGWLPVVTGQPASVDFTGVFAASATEVWVSGINTGTNQPLLLRWNGTAFNPETLPTAQRLNAVGGSGPGVVYAVGNAGTFLRWNGSAMVPIGVPVTSNLLTVSATSQSDVWAAGTAVPDPMNTMVTVGCVLKYNGTGIATLVRPLPNVTIYAASAASAGDVVFVGYDNAMIRGTMLKFSNGAYERQVDLSAYPTLRGVANQGNGSLWIVGSGGTMLRSSDGLAVSRLDSGLAAQTLFGVIAFPSTVVAVGSGRAILRASP
jgi:hypothetical protein